ncbi:MAG: PH domain-containing protein [Tetrasphaera sp.]|nr:PH domain-containing protein [Tetrasphaera sp.]
MASRWFPQGEVRARNRTGWLFVVLIAVVAVPTAVASIAQASALAPAVAVSALTALVIAYIYFVSPQVVATEEEILVVNPWRRHVVPWGAVIDADTRFNLTLVTPQKRVPALGAPSPGGFAAMRSKAERDAATRRVEKQRGGQIRPGDLPATQSGAIASVIRGHLRDLAEAGSLRVGEQVRTDPRVGSLAVTGGLLTLTAVLWLVVA